MEQDAVSGEREMPQAAPADPLGTVIPAFGFAAVAGVGLQAMVTLGVDALKAGLAPGAKPTLTSPHALMLLLGTPAGMVLAGLAAWYFLAPLGNPWRRSMLAIVAGLGSFVLSVLLIWPTFGYFGRRGLMGLVVASALLCLVTGRRLTASRTAP